MKRRLEHLVLKRDGRREFLRATKLARSIHLALHSVGVDEDWRALEVTTTVLAGLRRQRQLQGDDGAALVLGTDEIADAVQNVLVATGQAAAAVAFGAVQSERHRRRQTFGAGARGLGLEGPAMLPPVDAAPGRRLPRE